MQRLHRRTLRKAHLQVKQMVTDGFSARKIRDYLQRWALWWAWAVGTSAVALLPQHTSLLTQPTTTGRLVPTHGDSSS